MTRDRKGHVADSPNAALIGAAFGIGSALAYTLTNILLRQVASRTDLGWTAWATCLKAAPSAFAAWGLLSWRWSRGASGLGRGRSLWILILAGLMMQLGGNLLFQFALSLGGLALSVPLCFATLILSGALGGWFFLKEHIPRRTAISMALLIAAVFILSRGANAAAASVRPNPTFLAAVVAVVTAAVSGICFGLGGVAIRHSVSGRLSIAATIAPLVSPGVIIPALIAVQQLGVSGLTAVELKTHITMLAAGTFNAIGFFAVAAAMARLPLTRVNLINASQAALCALAGIIWFHEPATVWVAAGSVLTVVSLAILGSQRTTTMPDASLVMDADQPMPGQDPVKEIASLATDG